MSSETSRDGTVFPISALEDVLTLSRLEGKPNNIGHYNTRPIGWNTAFALYLEPLTAQVYTYSLRY